MKKRSLKIMSVVLAGVMTTGMILGGCSAGGDKENGGNKEASKELNLWMHNGQAFVDETKKLAENYEKETGVKINIQTFPYDAMSQKMKAAFTAGNEPDIMQVFGAWIPTYMNQKLLAEVPEELSANFETDYLQGAVDGYAKDGTYYGVPIEMNVEYGLFYNREDAAAAGVPDGPKTFDDVMKIAKNSAKFNGDVQEYGGLEFYNGDNFAALFLSWIMQNGGDFWNEDQTKFVLTSPEAKEAWQKLVDLVTVEKVTDNIPNMFLEAAEIDGANSIQKFFKITLPLMSRNMLFVVIMTCISYFQVFAQVQIMTQGGPENHTNVIGLNIYNYAFRYSQMGYASAMAVVLLGIILIVSLVQLKVGKQDWEY